MGLFDKITGDSAENEENLAEKTFDPIVIDSQDVLKELKNVAASNKLPLERIDFKLLKVNTQYKTKELEEWEDLTDDKKALMEDNTFYLNPDLQIQQHFKIEIFDAQNKDALDTLPDLSLGANKSLTKVVITVKKNLEISYSNTFERSLIEAINKKKIRAKIFVGFREGAMQKEVKKIASAVRINNLIENDSTFVVMEGIDPVAPVNDALIMHYKKKVKSEDAQGRKDYSRRGYLLAVDNGETIIEYIKPQDGMSGKTCRGTYLLIKEPKSDNEMAINITDAIIKKEDDKSIRYVSTCSGYVNEEGGNFDIKEEMELSEVNFKTTGSIEAGLDTNVTINIKEDDVFKDAIGEGMSVESSELNVDGNVGNNATIKAKKVWIGGQTHKTSNISAENAEIKVHRGVLEATEATIERLEGGKVFGDTVHVKSVIGGEIIAKKIYIEELASNASLITSEFIEIKNLKGNNNKFLVDPGKMKGFNKEIKGLNEKIAETKKDLDKMPKQLENKKMIIDKNKQSVTMVKEKIAELKSEGKKPPITFMTKLKEFQQLVNEYNSLLKTMKDAKYQLSDYQEELKQLQNKMFSAKIVNHSPWKEFNEIKFKLISPPVEVIHNTKDHEIARVMTLEQTTDDEFHIRRSSEYKT